MGDEDGRLHLSSYDKIAVDVGSTNIKLATLDRDGSLLHQSFFGRDFDAEIVDQIASILSDTPYDEACSELRICSSANGGLRVGVICLTPNFSGEVLRNQVLLGGANPIYVHHLIDRTRGPDSRYVDVLLIGGGVDCPDNQHLERFLESLDITEYRFGRILYAGDAYLRQKASSLFPDAKLVENPIADGFGRPKNSVFQALRDAYLDDLVYKEGVSELVRKFGVPIRPTPEVVNHGYYRAVSGLSRLQFPGASILIDIGGATTDLHYTVEIIRDDTESKPPRGTSVARYVFPDLGVFASRDTTMHQLRRHAQSFDFLKTFGSGDINSSYRALREGELDPDVGFLSYACLFLCIDRFLKGDGPGLPAADLDKISNYVFTGGAAQLIDSEQIARIIGIFTEQPVETDCIRLDRRYEVWVNGIWT